jgi:transcriptional regulator GlxA family with amidase domain
MSIRDERKRARRKKLTRKDAPSRIVPERTIDDSRVRIVIDFMRVNLHRKISLTDSARAVNLSAAHLSRLFKTETGLSPGEYLIRLRMEKARHLLTTTLLSIKEIMALTGYGNRGHFVEHFKRSFGPAPSEFRKGLSRS